MVSRYLALIAFSFGLGSAIVWLVALFSAPKEVRATHQVFAGVIGVLAYVTAWHYLHHLGHWESIPVLFSIPLPFVFLVPPSLYFYVRTLLFPEQRFRRSDLLHLLPCVLCFLAVLPWLVQDDVARKSFFFEGYFSPRWILCFLWMICDALYLRTVWQTVDRKERALTDECSDLTVFRLRWLRFLILTSFVLWGSSVGVWLSGFSGLSLQLMALGCGLTAFGFVIFGFRFALVFLQSATEASEGAAPAAGSPRYETSSLDPADLARLSASLQAYLVSSQCFLSSNLRLRDLAKALRISEYQASQVINVGMRETFFALINRYRIEEAKRRLSGPALVDSNILAVAYDVGFNSKSAFNAAFRKSTGMTPSQFRKSHSN